MLFFKHWADRLACGLCILALAAAWSCGIDNLRTFQIVPRSPAYLLRSPDRQAVPFSEVLKQYNSYVPGSGWVDLRPGMELRVENAYYEPGKSRKGLDGFLGTEVAHYAVTKNGLRMLSFQSMPNRPFGDPPVQDLVSRSALAAPYSRFYFEVLFRAASHAQSSVLLTAASMPEIDRLAAQMDEPEKVCGAGSLNCTVFPDACSVSIEMEISINGKKQSVVWSATLKSITGTHPVHVALKRLYKGRLVSVAIRQNDPEALQLPLLPGDEIRWH